MKNSSGNAAAERILASAMARIAVMMCSSFFTPFTSRCRMHACQSILPRPMDNMPVQDIMQEFLGCIIHLLEDQDMRLSLQVFFRQMDSNLLLACREYREIDV